MYVLSGTASGRFLQIPLGLGRHLVGRGSRNDINLQHNSVSREHAEILVERDRVLLKDLSSSNGTFVNGEQVTGEIEVGHRDEIGFGAQKLTLLNAQFSSPEEASPVSVLHQTVLALSEHENIHAQESLSWEEVTGGVGKVAAIDPVLFRAVTESGNLLMLPRPLSETFDLLLGILERVVRARRILLLLTDTPDGSPAIRAARPHFDPAGPKPMLSQTIIGTVLKDRQALLLNDAQTDPRFQAQQSVIAQNLRSAMVAPLFDNNEVIGLLYADNDDPQVRYDRIQLQAFTLLANLIAVKVTNARLLEDQREKERMEQEVAAAAQVQKQLLDRTLPSLPGYDLVARQIPCFEVAGDLYDITELADGRVAIVVGDVTGKGMGAALLMSNVIASLRILYQECPAPVKLAERVHRQVEESSDELRFVTLFLGLLDPRRHRLEYVNAGHNPPLLIHGQEIRTLDSTGMPMGLIPEATFTVGKTDLAPGSLLCIFSDGIPEAQVEGEFYGEERFLASTAKRAGRSLEKIADGALDDLRLFMGDNLLDDDVTLVLLRRHAEG